MNTAIRQDTCYLTDYIKLIPIKVFFPLSTQVYSFAESPIQTKYSKKQCLGEIANLATDVGFHEVNKSDIGGLLLNLEPFIKRTLTQVLTFNSS